MGRDRSVFSKEQNSIMIIICHFARHGTVDLGDDDREFTEKSLQQW